MTPFPAHLIPRAIFLLQQVRASTTFENLQNGDHYICHNLARAVGEKIQATVLPDPAAQLLLDYIQRQLDQTGNITLEANVASLVRLTGMDQHLPNRVSSTFRNNQRNLWSILMRQAWLDRMLYELQTEGRLP